MMTDVGYSSNFKKFLTSSMHIKIAGNDGQTNYLKNCEVWTIF